MCSLPELYSLIESLLYESSSFVGDGWHCFLSILWFFSVSTQLLLQCWADKRYDSFERNSSVELNSSFLNRILMSWFSSLPVQGSKQTLTEKDLFDLNEENTSEYLQHLWEQCWRPKVESELFLME